MANPSVLVVFLLATIHAVVECERVAPGNGEPLLLTPLIRAGKMEEARNRSLVDPKITTRFSTITSHAGFLTVVDRRDTNLFFWFVRAAVPEPDMAPLVMWLQGDGLSSLHAAFLENGPYKFRGERKIRVRKGTSWHQRANMLYVDATAGVGFSYSSGAYANTPVDIARQLNNALEQILQMFPQLKKNELFLAGESDACMYIAELCSIVVRQSTAKLRAFMVGSGYCDPPSQQKHAEYLYQLGLLDTKQYGKASSIERRSEGMMRVKRYAEAADQLDELRQLLNGSVPSYENVLESNGYKTAGELLARLMESPDVRLALHVGSKPFRAKGDEFLASFREATVAGSTVLTVANLLEHTDGYFYAGQLDAGVPYRGVADFLEGMRFPTPTYLGEAHRWSWSVGDQLGGYVRTAGRLTDVLVVNAGRWVGMERADAMYYLFVCMLDNKRI